MNISFTRGELEVLWIELCMLVDAADACAEDGIPRADDAVLRSLKSKTENARESASLPPESRRAMQQIRKVQRDLLAIASPPRRSKWDRFQS